MDIRGQNHVTSFQVSTFYSFQKRKKIWHFQEGHAHSISILSPCFSLKLLFHWFFMRSAVDVINNLWLQLKFVTK
jgi:hypothetical protein